ncbi:hypothetical protein BJ742DRAFT_838249 [Cladochytrium replicatum]|nr:hypothetical protein BJ742DRAFT_838249 [Cladochytrium replicatum]
MPHSSSNSAGASDEFHPHADLETDSHNESARATLRFKSVQRILKELQNVLSSGPPPVLHLLVSSRNVACQDERAKQTKKNGNLSANEVLKAAEEADDVGGLIESLAQLRLNQMNRVPEPTKTKRWLLRKQKTKEQNQLGVGEHEIVAQRMQFAIAPKQTVADRIKAKASSSLVRERGDDCDFIDTVSIPPRFSLDGIPRNSSSLYEPDRYAGTSPEPDFGMSGVIFEALRFDAETHSESILPENDDLAQLLELLSIDESEEQKSVLKDRPSIGPLSSYVASAETLRGHQLPRSKSKDSPNSPSMSELLEGIEGIDISKFFEPLDLETEE